jgi:hypothetical protein
MKMFESKNDDFDAVGQYEDARMLDEFQPDEIELVQGLLSLRQVPSGRLQQRVQKIGKAGHSRQPPEARRAGRRAYWPRLLLRSGVLAGTLAVTVLLLLATVPSVRAALDRLFEQRFGLVLVDPSRLEAPVNAGASGEQARDVEEDVEVVPPLSFDEVQARVGFPIPQPAVIPEGLALAATHFSHYPPRGGESTPQTVVVLAYRPAGGPAAEPEAALTLVVTDRTVVEGCYAVPAAAEEQVTVNGAPAVYARGAWERTNDDEPPALANMAWDAGTDAAMLSWEAEGYTYTLQGFLLGLSREDYIRIAESVR